MIKPLSDEAIKDAIRLGEKFLKLKDFPLTESDRAIAREAQRDTLGQVLELMVCRRRWTANELHKPYDEWILKPSEYLDLKKQAEVSK